MEQVLTCSSLPPCRALGTEVNGVVPASTELYLMGRRRSQLQGDTLSVSPAASGGSRLLTDGVLRDE